MDGGLRVHRTDHAQFVRVRRQSGKKLAELHSAPAVLCKLERRTLQPAAQSPHAGGDFARRFLVVLHRLVRELPVKSLQRGLRVERIHLRRTARAEDLDHPLRPHRKRGLSRREWGGLHRHPGLVQERRKAETAKAESAFGKELTAGAEPVAVRAEMGMHGDEVSSRTPAKGAFLVSNLPQSS